MIRFILLQNRAGKTRLAKFYVPLSDAEQRAAEADVFRATSAQRDARTPQANVMDWGPHKLVVRRYAGLAFAACIDAADPELAALEAIHLFVEVLDHYFGAVCELDLVFNFHKAYLILDEFVLGGEIQETSKKVILERLGELDRIET